MDFRSRHIPYKNVCLICQFALCLKNCTPGAELPDSCRSSHRTPETELPDPRQSSATRAPAGVGQHHSGIPAGAPAGSSAPGVQFFSPPCHGSIWNSECQNQSSFAKIPSQPRPTKATTSLYLLWKYQRRQTQP